MPFEFYPGICLTTEEKHGKTQSSRVVKGLRAGPIWLSFEGRPRLATSQLLSAGDFSLRWVDRSTFQVAEIRGFRIS
jgi:hypothetical protein